MKRSVVLLTVILTLLSPPVFSQDKPVVAEPAVAEPAVTTPTIEAGDVVVTPVVAEPAKSDGVVEDAEKLIDGSTEAIDNDPAAAISQLVELAKEGRWGPFVGLALMFLVWGLRRFIWKLIPKNALPWVTLGAGMVTTGAIELGLGVVWWKVLIDSLAASGIAMGMWSALFKHFMKPEEDT